MAEPDVDVSEIQEAEGLRRIDRIMEIVALAMFPVGLTALLLGWVGVASNGHVFLQLPYVVSGGFLGLGMLAMGGMIYLASWISRTSAAQRRQGAELLHAITTLQQTLAVLPLAGNGQQAGRRFIATPSGTMFHRPECAVVTNRDDTHPVDDPDGMRPCGMCDPLDADATTVISTTN